jgi:hypothetical protein
MISMSIKTLVMDKVKNLNAKAKKIAVNTMDKIIEIAVATLVAGTIEYTAITNLLNASTADWPVTYTAMWGLLAIFSLLGCALAVIAVVRQN